MDGSNERNRLKMEWYKIVDSLKPGAERKSWLGLRASLVSLTTGGDTGLGKTLSHFIHRVKIMNVNKTH